ncbi:MAG: hypothetical protein QGI12_00725 [Acidimicrobiales bacterium]|jgi:hypothetical protein|nr:hypothetical protein [Acidimicrobiales bacterium]
MSDSGVVEEFDEETGCMNFTDPSGAYGTNCPDGTGLSLNLMERV